MAKTSSNPRSNPNTLTRIDLPSSEIAAEGEEIGDFDETVRYLARLDGLGLFHWLLRDLMADFDFVEWMDARLTSAPNLRFVEWMDARLTSAPNLRFRRTGDLRARLRHRHALAPDCSIQLESQTRPEPGYPERLLEYQALYYRQMSQEGLQDQLTPFTIYLTGDGPKTLDTGHRGMPLGVRMDSGVKALRDEDAKTVLAEIKAGRTARIIAAFAPLMRGGNDRDIIEETKAAMAEAAESRLRDDLAAVALALAPLTGRKDRWQEHFKGWNMEQSEFLRSWVSRGVRQGVQQKAQQETTDHRLMLEKILKERFPKQASAQSLAKLASEPDLEVLKKWTVDAAVAKSWKAFRDAAGWK